MITINLDRASLQVDSLVVPVSALSADIEVNISDSEVTIGELMVEGSDHDDREAVVCHNNYEADDQPEDLRSVAQATADGVGERLIYPS